MVDRLIPDSIQRLLGWPSSTSSMPTYPIHTRHHLFVPSPTTKPLPIWAAIVPPLTYYIALFLLPPLSSKAFSRPIRRLASFTRVALALISIYTFASLPFKYYYPGSAVLTYQLGLVGLYGASRVLDVFFLSYPRFPRRIVNPLEPNTKRADGKAAKIVHPYTSARNEEWKTEPLPKALVSFERAWWALDLMISMRGIGWDFASADVRHDSHPWQPPSSAQLRKGVLQALPHPRGLHLGDPPPASQAYKFGQPEHPRSGPSKAAAVRGRDGQLAVHVVRFWLHPDECSGFADSARRYGVLWSFAK